MRVSAWLKLCGSGTRLCASGICCLFQWTLWLLLAVALGVQLFVATSRELPVPSFVLRQLEERLAAAGARPSFGAASFDPTGHILVRDLHLSLDGLPEPVLVARGVHLEVAPWALLVGHVRLDSVAVTGADLLVPAMLSASGKSEPLIREIDGRLHPLRERRGFNLEHLTAHVGPVALDASGAFTPPRGQPADSLEKRLARFAADYPQWSRDFAARLAQLPDMDEPHLSLRFDTPAGEGHGGVTGTLHARSIRTSPEPAAAAPPSVVIDGIRARFATRFAAPATRREVSGSVACDAIDALGFGGARQLRADVTLDLEATPSIRLAGFTAVVSAAGAESRGVAVAAPAASLASDTWPVVRGSALGLVFGQAIEVAGELNLSTKAGELAGSGFVAPDWIAWAGDRLRRDLGPLLEWRTPPRVSGSVSLGAGGKPASAAAQVLARSVTARGVALDAAAGRLSWTGTSLEVDDIRLVAEDSEVRGRYEMDTAARDFRFLLAGRLQPAVIDGWFREWWPRFWANFDFERPAEADVDVRGRWRDPRRTSVFVAADGAPVRLRGADFERIRTRAFVRPGFTDVIEFIAERGDRSARGTFTRTVDPAARQWRALTFDVKGNTDLAPAGQLFGEAGAAIVAPFTFSSPPRLRIRGRLDGPAAPGGRSADVQVEGEGTGEWTFHHFPLRDLEFKATVRSDVIQVEDIVVGFAGGIGSGRAEVRGRDAERELSFDLSLNGARLGESIRTLEIWSASQRGEAPPPASRFQQRAAAGLLQLGLSAEGKYDDPSSLRGLGHGAVTGANLGEINVLGLLSTLLRRTIFNFTTLQLDTARGSFELADGSLHFNPLRLSGPRAAIDASGSYALDSHQLDFVAKVLPFDASEGVVGATVGAMLTPLSNALEVKLGGRLDRPKWAFVYGPTNLLRTLAGEGPAPGDPPPPPAGR